jgi:hypothetical protein
MRRPVLDAEQAADSPKLFWAPPPPPPRLGADEAMF